MVKNIVWGLILTGIMSALVGASASTYFSKQPEPKILAQKPAQQIGQDLKDSQKILDRKPDLEAIVKRRNEIDKELAEIKAENKAILVKAEKDREAIIEAKRINENLTRISKSIDEVRQEDLNRRIRAYNQSTADFIQKIDRRNKDLEQALSVPMTPGVEKAVQEHLKSKQQMIEQNLASDDAAPTTDLVNGNSQEAINYRQRRVQESLKN
jgi:hypothetical protein